MTLFNVFFVAITVLTVCLAIAGVTIVVTGALEFLDDYRAHKRAMARYR